MRAQPIRFYSPQSLVADARRHGVIVYEPDINASLTHATLEAEPESTGGHAIRLGLAAIRNVGDNAAEAIVTERQANGPYSSIGELTERVRLKKPAVEALATAGAFTSLGPERRQALWAAGAAATTRPEHLPEYGLRLVVLPPPVSAGIGTIQLRLGHTVFGEVRLSLCPVDRRAILIHIEVEEKHRRRGAGRVLVNAAVKRGARFDWTMLRSSAIRSLSRSGARDGAVGPASPHPCTHQVNAKVIPAESRWTKWW